MSNGGFSSITGDEKIVSADNASFDGTERGGKMTTDGQLWIGSTAAPHVRLGTIVGGTGVTVTPGAGSVTVSLSGGGSAIDSLTPNSGTSPVVPDGNGNVGLTGSGSTTTVGGTNTLSVELTGLTNHAVLIGAGTSTITKVGPIAATGAVLQSNGVSSDPGFSTATYPSIATGTGKILRADGTNWTPTTATFPDTAGTSGNVLTSNGTNWTSAAPASSAGTITGDTGGALSQTTGNWNILSNVAGINSGSSVAFAGATSTLTLNLTDASDNTLLGENCGNATLSGTANTGSGVACLSALTTGANNACVGVSAGAAITTGSRNVIAGRSAKEFGATGSDNTILGYNAARSLPGDNNIAIGQQTMVGATNAATTKNTAVGGQALANATAPTNNVCIGYDAGSALTGSESNNLFLGYLTQGTAGDNNKIIVGNSSHTTCFIKAIRGVTTANADAVAVLVDSAGQLGTVSSSIRYKENVDDMGDVSSPLLNLRPVTFDFIDKPSHRKQVGLIAEEVQEIMPSLVVVDSEGLPETVRYHELPVLLLNEIQKLLKRIEALEAR